MEIKLYFNNLPWHFAKRRGGRKPPVPPFFQHSGCLRYSQITPTERVNLTKNLGKRSMELHDANKVHKLLKFKACELNLSKLEKWNGNSNLN